MLFASQRVEYTVAQPNVRPRATTDPKRTIGDIIDVSLLPILSSSTPKVRQDRLGESEA